MVVGGRPHAVILPVAQQTNVTPAGREEVVQRIQLTTTLQEDRLPEKQLMTGINAFLSVSTPRFFLSDCKK